MAPISNNKNPKVDSAEPARPARRERRSTKSKPAPAEVAAEAAAIYPDTFDTPPTAEEIAAEAYAIYLSRGADHGRHEDDWFEAERRVSERRRNLR